uniref:Zinc finger protein n=1 Tax=Steinernema glaseri TaxID=37863 RepID=A0A1I7YNA9_9BILA
MEVHQHIHHLHHQHHFGDYPIKTEVDLDSGMSPPKMIKTESTSSSSCSSEKSEHLYDESLFDMSTVTATTAPMATAANGNAAIHLTQSTTASRKSANSSSKTDRKRPYPCNLCPSRFGSKMELEEHQNSHTGQKPFECDVCKSRFNRRSTLWNHKRIHSDAKPFVCPVCQMTFKWKNSLKCHKEMHLRKNESSAIQDSDLRQLTYATAAKRKLLEAEEANGTASTSASSALITTTQSKKKSKGSIHAATAAAASHNGTANLSATSSSMSTIPLCMPTTTASGCSGQMPLNHHSLHQPLNANVLLGPPNDHQFDLLDTQGLDSLVNNNNSILMQAICTGDMIDQSLNHLDLNQLDLRSRQASHLLSQFEDSSMFGGHLLDTKSDIAYSQAQSIMQNGGMHSPMGASTASSTTLNVRIPLLNTMIGSDIGLHLNHFQHGNNRLQQQQHMHHLTASPDYAIHCGASNDNSLHSQQSPSKQSHFNIPPASAQNELVLNQPVPSYHQQFQMDPTLLIAANQCQQGEYMPNFEYTLPPYSANGIQSENDVCAMTHGSQQLAHPVPLQMQSQVSQQTQQSSQDASKELPFDRW